MSKSKNKESKSKESKENKSKREESKSKRKSNESKKKSEEDKIEDTKDFDCIHIFRRDYRLFDNMSLIKASKEYNEIIPVFIFTYDQIRDNSYKSDICVKFLIGSLKDLDKDLKKSKSKLRVYYGEEINILKSILKNNNNIKGISFNKDYTKYSHMRDKKIINLCKELDVNIICEEDYLLQPLGTVLTGNDTVYTKFTPFYNNLIKLDVKSPDDYKIKNLYSLYKKIKGYEEYTASLDSFYDMDKVRHVKMIEEVGRKGGMKILNEIKKGSWDDYDKKRNLLTYETTHLSPYNKFGCISIREEFHLLKKHLGIKSGLVRQLVWRDFFYNLSANNHQIYSGSLLDKYRDIKWKYKKSYWDGWTNGCTGYPIVDACMMEIKNTGYMHNRARLIASNFLVRILSIDWRKGEKWFAQHLYDYDPAQNNFGWQVNAGVSGTESRPITQTILNPWIQSKKFDPDCEYIKKWLPNLSDVENKHLHKWESYFDKYDLKEIDYVKPIIDYKEAREDNIKLYKKYI